MNDIVGPCCSLRSNARITPRNREQDLTEELQAVSLVYLPSRAKRPSCNWRMRKIGTPLNVASYSSVTQYNPIIEPQQNPNITPL